VKRSARAGRTFVSLWMEHAAAINCAACMIGRMKLQPYLKSKDHAKQTLRLVYIDIMSLSVTSLKGIIIWYQRSSGKIMNQIAEPIGASENCRIWNDWTVLIQSFVTSKDAKL
jgi:hypothetical protein